MTANQPRILLLDDEESICRVLQVILADCGYAIAAYTRPQEAIAAFTAGHYELVISDFEMPVMDGVEVLQRIKQVNPKTPVILITGYPLEQIAKRALDQGAYDILAKPFHREELLSRIRDVLCRPMASGEK
jgi:CheY-like chemotaxis protein